MLITLRFSNNRFFLQSELIAIHLARIFLQFNWKQDELSWIDFDCSLSTSAASYFMVQFIDGFSVINLKSWLLSTQRRELLPFESNGWWSLRYHSCKFHQRKNFMSINVMRVEVDKKRAKRKRKHLQLVYPVMKITMWTNRKKNSSSRLSDRRKRERCLNVETMD
jgi:hypothetical protein